MPEVCQRIEAVGKTFQVKKRDGNLIATGWNNGHLAVTPNESKEVGDPRVLLPDRSPDRDALGIPWELIHAHDVTADCHEGVIDTTIQYEARVSSSMFHLDEVNEEAILFANWAYRSIHDAIIPYRYAIAGSALLWLIKLPDSIEILCSAAADGAILTEFRLSVLTTKTLRIIKFDDVSPVVFSEIKKILA
ncbi:MULTISPECIES: hypothetical protein [unclassified Microcoleus]|uniref:hypothetical protein n=1 Tax=unclassified Microcoleus TaxID=2642155 RepID=UPI002FD721C8